MQGVDILEHVFYHFDMRDTSDLRVWFREDIAKVLMGVNAASHAMRAPQVDTDAFHDGFVAALVSVALVFGVKPEWFLLPDDLDAVQHALQDIPRITP